MTATEVRPDAVLVPDDMKQGKTTWARQGSIVDIAHAALENRPNERAYCRDALVVGFGKVLFCSRSIHDTVIHPVIHPTLAGKPRYRWVPSLKYQGISNGYLLEREGTHA